MKLLSSNQYEVLKAKLIEFHPRFYHFVKLLPENAKLLDLGCGRGLRLGFFRRLRPDIQCYGVDIVDQSSLLPPNIHFYMADLNSEKLPFQDASFDGVLLSHVLEHLENYDLLASEVFRVLKQGGLHYAEVPSIRSVFVPSFRCFGHEGNPFNFYDDITHKRPFTKKGLASFIEKCNLRIIKIGTARNPLKFLLSPLLILAGVIKRKRNWVTTAVWDMVGWAIYGIGKKD
ncbi:MAG TPA: class I SAM-dependent methyltransferase [Candidatus Nitrosotenuis sp.]|nr:class I SAM-dependent methyltransferase [Candidatus Nitrosotenuis sp.]